MGFNYKKEWKLFTEEWKKLRKEYEKAGMSEDAISAMYNFDLQCFRSRRRYFTHTQPLPELYVGEGEQIPQIILFRKYPELSTSFDERDFSDRYAWIESVNDNCFYEKLQALSQDDLELLTLLAVDRYSQADIARLKGCSRNAIAKKISRIKKFLK